MGQERGAQLSSNLKDIISLALLKGLPAETEHPKAVATKTPPQLTGFWPEEGWELRGQANMEDGREASPPQISAWLKETGRWGQGSQSPEYQQEPKRVPRLLGTNTNMGNKDPLIISVPRVDSQKNCQEGISD